MLGSFYQGLVAKESVMPPLRAWMSQIKADAAPVLMVTHYVVIADLTGHAVASGGLVLYEPPTRAGADATPVNHSTSAAAAEGNTTTVSSAIPTTPARNATASANRTSVRIGDSHRAELSSSTAPVPPQVSVWLCTLALAGLAYVL